MCFVRLSPRQLPTCHRTRATTSLRSGLSAQRPKSEIGHSSSLTSLTIVQDDPIAKLSQGGNHGGVNRSNNYHRLGKSSTRLSLTPSSLSIAMVSETPGEEQWTKPKSHTSNRLHHHLSSFMSHFFPWPDLRGLGAWVPQLELHKQAPHDAPNEHQPLHPGLKPGRARDGIELAQKLALEVQVAWSLIPKAQLKSSTLFCGQVIESIRMPIPTFSRRIQVFDFSAMTTLQVHSSLNFIDRLSVSTPARRPCRWEGSYQPRKPHHPVREMLSPDVTGPHWATQLTACRRDQRPFGKTASDDSPFKHYQFC